MSNGQEATSMGKTPSPNDVAISVRNVSKTFRLPHERQTSIKGLIINGFRKRKSYEIQDALKGLNFEVKKGEFFGIVGRNGSGKSTLLKCIAGVYPPDSGEISVSGSLVPFIELGVGFNPELSGRDNVFLNGALLGFNRKQMEEMYDEIVEFAELEQFMDQKLKNYSSGMQVRLAFSIAIRAQGDILLLDEVLAVGDAAFQQKCLDYFSTLKRGNKTIVLVTHSMSTIERFCDKAILIENSKIKSIGDSSDIAGLYEEVILKTEVDKKDNEADKSQSNVKHDGVTAKVNITQNGKQAKAFKAFEDLRITIEIENKKAENIPEAYVGLNIRNSEGEIVFAVQTEDEIGTFELKKRSKEDIIIDIDNIFTNGTYYISLSVASEPKGAIKQLFSARKITAFTIFGVKKNIAGSVTHPHRKVNRG